MYKDNLWRAILAVYQSKSAYELIVNIDRLGNAICAGDYRTTISGRVGFFALTKLNRYWYLLQWIIDETFRPIDGRHHCKQAFIFEKKQGLNHRRGNDVALGLLSIVVIAACLILAPIILIISLFHR